VGGVFYEHGHRMIASVVGLLMFILCLWIHFKEERKWVKVIGYVGLAAVICQGVLGGITVLFYLPTAVSVSHGILAQTFFLITIFLAYSQSRERIWRADMPVALDIRLQKAALILVATVYVQLILGAIMRHTGSGLAIYDFPTMGGQWWPRLNDAFLVKINAWRWDQDLDPVQMFQVVFHLLHRVGALFVCGAVLYLNYVGRNLSLPNHKQIYFSIWFINILICVQILLGITSVLTLKIPVVTSLHVMGGATVLGLSFLLFLRVVPTSSDDLRWQS